MIIPAEADESKPASISSPIPIPLSGPKTPSLVPHISIDHPTFVAYQKLYSALVHDI